MRARSSCVVLLVLLLAVLACSADPIGVRLSTAKEARRLWQSSRPDAYEMTFRGRVWVELLAHTRDNCARGTGFGTGWECHQS